MRRPSRAWADPRMSPGRLAIPEEFPSGPETPLLSGEIVGPRLERRRSGPRRAEVRPGSFKEATQGKSGGVDRLRDSPRVFRLPWACLEDSDTSRQPCRLRAGIWRRLGGQRPEEPGRSLLLSQRAEPMRPLQSRRAELCPDWGSRQVTGSLATLLRNN